MISITRKKSRDALGMFQKMRKRRSPKSMTSPESQWKNYEFDHLIPLCAGGSNDSRNIWPQPLDEAHEKDKVEDEVCQKMRAGEMKQAEAVHEIFAWFEGKKSHPLHF